MPDSNDRADILIVGEADKRINKRNDPRYGQGPVRSVFVSNR